MSCLWKRIREKLLSQPISAWSTAELANTIGEEFAIVRTILNRMKENALLRSRAVSEKVYHAWYTAYEEDYPFAKFWML